MVEFLPFYFFLFVTFPTFQCRYVYQYPILFYFRMKLLIRLKLFLRFHKTNHVRRLLQDRYLPDR